MFCPQCSTELPDDAKFCIKCRYDFTRIKTLPSKKLEQDSLDGLGTSIQKEADDVGNFDIDSLFADRYEILSEGHKGGMGAVYKCKDTMLNKIKALKVIHPRLVSSKQAISRFRQCQRPD
jgi:serine/threonine protein kinase